MGHLLNANYKAATMFTGGDRIYVIHANACSKTQASDHHSSEEGAIYLVGSSLTEDDELSLKG